MKKIIFLALTLCITTAPSLFAQGNGNAYGKTKQTTTVRTYTTTRAHRARTTRARRTGVANARAHGGRALAKGHYTIHHRKTTTVTKVY